MLFRYLKLQDNSNSSDSCESPLKAQLNTVHHNRTVHNTSEPYYVENSIEEMERLKKEEMEKDSSFLNLLQNSTDSARTSVIPETSDSEEDKKSVRRCLSLNRIKPNKVLVEREEAPRASAPKASCSIESNDDFTLSNSEISLNKSKENLKTASASPRSMENECLRTPKKSVNNKQRKNTVISDSDTDSPRSKCSDKGSPRKEWVGPDIKLNLKDLGLNNQLNPWIQSIQKKSAMSTIPVSFLL